jgi:hypothetical protein
MFMETTSNIPRCASCTFRVPGTREYLYVLSVPNAREAFRGRGTILLCDACHAWAIKCGATLELAGEVTS